MLPSSLCFAAVDGVQQYHYQGCVRTALLLDESIVGIFLHPAPVLSPGGDILQISSFSAKWYAPTISVSSSSLPLYTNEPLTAPHLHRTKNLACPFLLTVYTIVHTVHCTDDLSRSCSCRVLPRFARTQCVLNLPRSCRVPTAWRVAHAFCVFSVFLNNYYRFIKTLL